MSISWIPGYGRFGLRAIGLGAFSLAAGLTHGMEAMAQVTPPDTVVTDTIPVDSTELRIFQQLSGLARPPGVDSVYFLPDSLMPDSLREVLEARRGQGRMGGRGRGGERASAAGSSLSPGDSILQALRELPGFSLTEYESLGANFGAEDRQLILLGEPGTQAKLVADGQELTADSLFYDEEQGKVWSTGEVASFTPADGDPVDSRIIVFDINEERGTALDATTKYGGMNAEWIVHGDLTSVNDTASWGNRLQFTSCELEEPHYHFASNNVKIVKGNLLVARPVKLYFADVPVAWLPFIVQNMDQGRSSGLLTPTFSINDIVRTSSGYSRRISNLGFYWAASEYYDATVFLDWWSGEHLSLTGSTRFSWAKQFLNGNFNFRQFWRDQGGTEKAFDGSANWEATERTRLRFRARYTSSTSLVRQTSFNPMEVVQSIDSEGGLTHRFDFGNLTLSANRKQYLTDDRVEMTAPNLSFSLSPMTFFKAAGSQARFYNNITLSGSAQFRRNISDRQAQPDTADFSRSLADKVNTSAGFRSSLTMGNLSLGGSLDYKENLIKEVPVGEPQGGPLFPPRDSLDLSTGEANWSASLGYQQRLIGSTSLTPSVSISSQLKRDDENPLARNFVAGPTRMNVGVSLRTDLYGFFGGIGPFEAIRHKISTGFDFAYSPEVTPTQLQRDVFGSTDARTQRTLRISLNQTWEARRKEDPNAGTPAPAGPGAGVAVDSLGLPVDPAVSDSLAGSPMEAGGFGQDSLQVDSVQGPRATGNSQKVTLLALKTTAISYDFEEARERGDWLWGVGTSALTNTVSSDYLRGLNITFVHDLFDDRAVSGGTGTGGTTQERSFSPHLSSLNFGFSLNNNSLPFRMLTKLLGSSEEEAPAQASATPASAGEEDPLADPFAPSLNDEASIIPGGSDPGSQRRSSASRQSGGGWRANMRFSMQRPRDPQAKANQMLQGSLNFSLTENWDATWRTSYDLLNRNFNDHYITLTRNLHRWEAHFDFTKTATGNWAFRFEVALMDQEDLHFDYSQRSYQDTSGRRRF